MRLLPLELREPPGDAKLGSLGTGVAVAVGVGVGVRVAVGVGVGVRVGILVASSEIRLCWYL